MDLASGIAGLTSLALELTTITYHYIRDVRNAPEESKQFHEELTALRTNLEELQRFLVAQGAQQVPFTKTSALVVSTNVCKDDLNYLKGKLGDFKRLYEQRKWYRRLAWPFQREEHAQVLRRIKDYTQTFHFSVSLEGCSLLAKTSKEIDEIHKQQRDSSRDVSEISTIVARLDTTIKCSIDHHFQEIRKSFENSEQKKLLDWLSKVDPSRNHNAAIEVKEPKTGEWFINSETFSQWVESAGLIWLYGIPGCGKTVLCSSIVECIQHLCRRASARCKSAYFYFNFQAVAEQNLNLVLRLLLRQLSANEARLPSAVQELYDTHDAIGHSPSTRDLKDALLRTIEELGKEVYIVLDALDEVLDQKERGKVLEYFATLASSRLGNLHLLATSRDEWDIRKSLECLSQGGIPIQRHEVDSDIRKYVGSCLEDLEGVPQEMKPLIQDKVGAGAHGMFRWAACQVETIRDCRTVAEIERALDDLPETLDETYERILQTIWRKDAEKARAILTWLLFSERPLILHEMAEAAVVRPGDMKIDHRDRLIQLSAVLSICRSLIILSDNTYYPNFMDGIYGGQAVQLVYFAHFSVKEYLISGRSKVFTGLPSPSHEYIGHCCISMLLPIDHVGLQSIGRDRLPHGMLEDLVRGQHLLFYAATSWVFHIKQLEAHKEVPETLSHDVCKLLNRRSGTENYHMWMELYNQARSKLSATFLFPLEKFEEGDFLLCEGPLFYARRLGLARETYRGIKAGSDINHELTKAVRENDLGFVCFLLEHGANINRALQDAARTGNLETFKLLLKRRTSISATKGHDVALLMSAMEGASLEITSRLVRSGVDINAPASIKIDAGPEQHMTFYSTALHYASYMCKFDMVKYLLKKGAKIDTPGFSLGTELQAAIRSHARSRSHASSRSHVTVHRLRRNDPMRRTLRCLIKGGANVNQQLQTRSLEIPSTPPFRKKGTALQQAAAQGLDSIAGILVWQGADIDSQHNHCGTALMCASRHAKPRTLRVLIDNKADVNGQVAGLGSALTDAAKWGRCENVQFLIESGAGVDAEVEGVGTALLTALLHGQFGTAAVLIEAGASLHAAVRDMSKAFSLASDDEGKEIIKLCFSSYHPYPKVAEDRRQRKHWKQSNGKRKNLRSCI